jgi:hypothetical protein
VKGEAVKHRRGYNMTGLTKPVPGGLRKQIHLTLACTLNGLHTLACSESETMNTFRKYRRAPWTGDRPILSPPPTQDSTTQRKHGYATTTFITTSILIFTSQWSHWKWCYIVLSHKATALKYI